MYGSFVSYIFIYIKLIHKTSKVNNVMSKIDISRVKNTFIKRIHINNLINSGIK